MKERILTNVPVELQREYRFVLLEAERDRLRIGVGDLLGAAALRDLAFATGRRVEQVVLDAGEIEEHLARLGPSTPAAPMGNVSPVEAPAGEGVATSRSRRAESSPDIAKAPGMRHLLPFDDLREGPVVQQVDRLIHRAVELGASDIHVEPYERSLRVRYRLDGVLHLAGELDPVQRDAVVSRIKVLAALDIAEKRRPQDGRIRVAYRAGGTYQARNAALAAPRPPRGGPGEKGRNGDSSGDSLDGGLRNTARRDADTIPRAIDLRVSVLPTQFGEKVVLRVLDRVGLRLDVEALGLEGRSLALFRQAIEAPHGMVLVTGPTGSGKTTTLYAALSALATGRVNVTTVEDPVEYDIEGVNQAQVRPDIGFGFAEALRSFLRQDPDVIMVGEVRDTETAEVAIRSALTGHLVLSTLHTNDAPSTVTRLVDMGVEPYLVAASVRLAVAQRLVRTICTYCKEPLPSGWPTGALGARVRELVGELGGDKGPGGSERPVEVERSGGDGVPVLFRGAGCAACGGTGYRGRAAVFELMPVTEAVAGLITQGASAQAIRRQAEEEGMASLQAAAARKLARGETTVEEVVRVTSA